MTETKKGFVDNVETHKDTKERNFRCKFYIVLDRKKDKNYDSQVRYYTGYRFDAELTDMVIINHTRKESVFYITKERRGYFQRISHVFLTDFYGVLRKYRKEIRRGILDEDLGDIERKVMILTYYMLFGIKETLMIYPTDTTTIILNVRTLSKRNGNAKFHKFKNLEKLRIVNEINPLTLPAGLPSLRIEYGIKIPSCVDMFNFDVDKETFGDLVITRR